MRSSEFAPESSGRSRLVTREKVFRTDRAAHDALPERPGAPPRQGPLNCLATRAHESGERYRSCGQQRFELLPNAAVPARGPDAGADRDDHRGRSMIAGKMNVESPDRRRH